MQVRSGPWFTRAVAMVAALVIVIGLGQANARAAATDATYVVKYYVVVAAANGEAESLADIAERLLGDPARAVDILRLNIGRPQADGGHLTDPPVLQPGWVLILPWDAIGDAVVLGPVPTVTPTPTGRPTAGPSPPATPVTTGEPTCTSAPAKAADIPWPQLRLAPDHAWSTSRGEGVVVAILDSAVESTPALAGRVAPARTIDAGATPSSCAGLGTALATIIAGQPIEGHGLVGIAPQATVLPIELDRHQAARSADQLIAGLAAAADAEATVAMIGFPVDLRDPAIDRAVVNAVTRDVVVVVAASHSGSARPGVLRVGSVGADDRLARSYPDGAVDVVAPGAGVTAARADGVIEGSGTDFAVAFVAGLVALVRSASPTLSAAAVTRHIELTTQRAAGQPQAGTVDGPDARYGWGIINPAAAVTGFEPAERTSPGSRDNSWLVAGVALALLAGWAGLSYHRRRVRPDNPDMARTG